MSNYGTYFMRKLSKPELQKLSKVLTAAFSDTDKHADIAAFVKDHYPQTAVLAQVHIDSEYNDNTYDNRIGYIEVRDRDGVELFPKNGREASAAQKNLELPVCYDTPEAVSEPVTVYIAPVELPTLYVE